MPYSEAGHHANYLLLQSLVRQAVSQIRMSHPEKACAMLEYVQDKLVEYKENTVKEDRDANQ